MGNEKKTARKLSLLRFLWHGLVCHTFLVSPLFLEFFDFMDAMCPRIGVVHDI